MGNSSLLIALLMSKSVLMNWLNRPFIVVRATASLKIHSRHHLAIFMVIAKTTWIGFSNEHTLGRLEDLMQPASQIDF